MSLDFRRLFVGVLSLGVLVGLFVLYVRLSGDRPAQMSTAQQFVDTIPDVNKAEQAGGKVGTVADVDVLAVRQSRFLHRGKDDRVDREFGFEALLHESDGQWEIEKPYMNIFLPNLSCSVTADKGNVRVETAFGQATPNDATFYGNVVIHVVPAGAGRLEECVIYLDSAAFISKRSLFSSLGAVKFVSASAKLIGSGLELTYDDTQGGLSLFRVTKLESLRLKSSAFGVLSQDGGAAAPVQGAKSAESGYSVVSGSRAAKAEDKYYQCKFLKNAVVRTPKQVVIAEDELWISDVLWQRSEERRLRQEAAGRSDDSGGAAAALRQRVPPISDRLLNLPDELFDIVVKCDGEMVVAPMGTAAEQEAFGSDAGAARGLAVDVLRGESAAGGSGRTLFHGRRIRYNTSTQETVALGPVRLVFYADVNDTSAAGKGRVSLPVTVDARKRATFTPATNRVVFDGDCLCTAISTTGQIVSEYKLASPQLILDVVKGAGHGFVDPNVGLSHLATGGGSAKLTIVRKAGLKVVGGVQLEGTQFDYDARRQRFIAAGPGTIRLNNSGAQAPAKEQGGFSLRRPCYAFLRDFDTLEYLLEAGRLVAAADSHEIILDYFPVVGGRYGPHARAVVGRMEAQLEQDGGGVTELVSITASKGITYEDETSQFAGSELHYDHAKSAVRIKGSGDQPCYFNGALVDGIEMDLKTRKAKAQIPAPSILQLGR